MADASGCLARKLGGTTQSMCGRCKPTAMKNGRVSGFTEWGGECERKYDCECGSVLESGREYAETMAFSRRNASDTILVRRHASVFGTPGRCDIATTMIAVKVWKVRAPRPRLIIVCGQARVPHFAHASR